LIQHLKVRRVTIAARRPARATRLIHELQDRMPPARLASAAFRPVVDLEEALSQATLVVNATPIGTGSDSKSRVLPKGAHLRPGAIAFDLIYKPRPTSFAREARLAGANRVIDGWPMLIAQAEAAFRLWTGRGFPADVRRTLLKRRQLP
jgi:shikimate 5-dehydrogenase